MIYCFLQIRLNSKFKIEFSKTIFETRVLKSIFANRISRGIFKIELRKLILKIEYENSIMQHRFLAKSIGFEQNRSVNPLFTFYTINILVTFVALYVP